MSERFPRLTASEVDEVLGRSGFGACTRPSTPRGLQDKKVSSWAWARVLKITRCFLGPPLIRAFLQETGTSHSGSVASHKVPGRHAKASFAWHPHSVTRESEGRGVAGNGAHPPEGVRQVIGNPLGRSRIDLPGKLFDTTEAIGTAAYAQRKTEGEDRALMQREAHGRVKALQEPLG